MPILGDPSQATLTESMRTKVPKVLRLNTPEAPRAIVLVTAHWETDVVTISNGVSPKLYYDYYNFPKDAYEFKYPAPGEPDVAQKVADALKREGVESEMDAVRGWDHGVFIPMMMIHPAADIPIVQVSVLESQDPQQLFKMGRALASLREENIAIVGSGMASFHNMAAFRRSGQSENTERVQNNHPSWLGAIRDAVSEEDIAKREERLVKWRDIDGAYDAHPRDRAEHFSPLVVAAGAAGNGKAKSWMDKALGWDMETFYWDD